MKQPIKERGEGKKCESNDLVYLSNPVQYKCKNCGQFWFPEKGTPDCKIVEINTIFPMTPNTPSHNEEVGKIFSLIGSELENYFNSQYPIPDHKVIMGYLGEALMDALLVYRNSIESEVRKTLGKKIVDALEKEIENPISDYDLGLNAGFTLSQEVVSRLTTPVKPLQD
jgi:hypothetical protein